MHWLACIGHEYRLIGLPRLLTSCLASSSSQPPQLSRVWYIILICPSVQFRGLGALAFGAIAQEVVRPVSDMLC